jgi:GAF domain-containing protein
MESCPQKGLILHRQDSPTAATILVGEGHLLELISTGAPLAQILNEICTTLDLQVGNVVSLVLLPDDEEHAVHTIARIVVEFGLFVFCCAAIVSPDEELLGTFEVYSCLPRGPTLSECRLIERAVHLAALAIQRQLSQQDSGSFPLDWKDAMGRNVRNMPPFKN